MIIQHLLMPKSGVCGQHDMFSRLNKRAYFSDEHQTLTIYPHGVAWFDTYFNSLSIGKWKKYTDIGTVSLTLRLKGQLEISLYRKEKIHAVIAETELLTASFQSEREEEITLTFPGSDEKGMYFFRLEGVKGESKFYGGWYSAEIPEGSLRDVDLAIDICTFKREAFVERNLEILHQVFLDDESSPLHGHLHVFISDNGKTLDIPALAGESVQIVPNKNVGGAGGFTRGLIEIMHCPTYQASHVLFMDDDVVIEPEALYRTYAMLRCRKEKYIDAFIGGAMLRMDQPNIQVEAGAAWYAGDLMSRKGGLDLNSVDAFLYNEVEEYVEFNAWWYCCTPMTVVNENNLPLPIFIRGDDLEYGLRNMRHLILLNGICVWHEPFENKYSSFLSYYILRNLLYDNALHCPGYTKWQFLRRLCGTVVRELFCYRYKNVDLIFRGVEDFLKGVDFLKETDGEKLHQQIMAAGYKAVPVEELDMPFEYSTYDNSLVEEENKVHKLFRLLTFNGLFLPAKGNNIVSMAQCRPLSFYRAKRVMQYDVASGKAFMTEKSITATLGWLVKTAFKSLHIAMQFDGAKERFRANAADIISEQAWCTYLGLERSNEYVQ